MYIYIYIYIGVMNDELYELFLRVVSDSVCFGTCVSVCMYW